MSKIKEFIENPFYFSKGLSFCCLILSIIIWLTSFLSTIISPNTEINNMLTDLNSDNTFKSTLCFILFVGCCPLLQLIITLYLSKISARLKGENKKIKGTKILLKVLMVYSLICYISNFIQYLSDGNIFKLITALLSIPYVGTFTIYLLGIWGKKVIIGNKLFLIMSIIYVISLVIISILPMLRCLSGYFVLYSLGVLVCIYSNVFFTLIITPFFYNYFKLIKEVKQNG